MTALLLGITLAFSITGQAFAAPRLCWYGGLQTYLTCAKQHKIAVHRDGEGSGNGVDSEAKAPADPAPAAEPPAVEPPTPEVDMSNVDADQDRGQGGYGRGELSGK